jgi:hypothetical protein
LHELTELLDALGLQLADLLEPDADADAGTA